MYGAREVVGRDELWSRFDGRGGKMLAFSLSLHFVRCVMSFHPACFFGEDAPMIGGGGVG